jgi:hypothetical protein
MDELLNPSATRPRASRNTPPATAGGSDRYRSRIRLHAALSPSVMVAAFSH